MGITALNVVQWIKAAERGFLLIRNAVSTGRALLGLQGSDADHARTGVIGHLDPEHAGQPCGEAQGEADAVCAQMEPFRRRLECAKSLHWCEVICHTVSVANRHALSKQLAKRLRQDAWDIFLSSFLIPSLLTF